MASQMHRIIPLLICAIFSGCNTSIANAPLLRLSIKGERGWSTGIFRVQHTGVITESGVGNSGGEGISERVTVDKIADDGITVTIEISDSSAEDQRKQIFIPYGEETTFDFPSGTTVTASVEQKP
jgi:hypothetical protein